MRDKYRVITIDGEQYPLRKAYDIYKQTKRWAGKADFQAVKERLELTWQPASEYFEFMDAYDIVGHVSDSPIIQMAAIKRQIDINNGTIDTEVHNVFSDIKSAVKSIFRR